MPILERRLVTIVLGLENDTWLGGALGFPELGCYGDDPAQVVKALAAQARRLVEAAAPLDVHRRGAPAAPATEEVTLRLDAPPGSAAWTRPVDLGFHVVRWAHADEACLAYVPALDLTVVARRAGELTRALPAEIRAALGRACAATSLAALAPFERCRELRVETVDFKAAVKNPRERAVEEAAGAAARPVLEEVGTDLARAELAEAYEADELVGRIAEALAGREPRSVLLVGRSGVGKTAAVHELVRRRAGFALGHTPFWATSGARLVAGMTGFGMWQERCQRLWREAARLRAILALGPLVELLEVGKGESVGQGIAGFLRPYIGRGDLLVIAECRPDQVPFLEREDPHLLEVFHRIDVEEPGPERRRRILGRAAQALAARREVEVAEDAVDEIDRLHARYATYSAAPGRPLRFLDHLVHDLPPGARLDAAVVAAAFGRETGLPRLLLDDAARLDLAAARAWFDSRVIGQGEALDSVVDLLAAVKAGLTRPRRPLASLLFAGPTGVGKTETAKALAEFLFGDRGRLVRFDMSEYGDPAGAARLAGGLGGEGLLTARVREQPFSVLLLDECEKAHPIFFDFLLQVLGDARLTDAAGRVADFTSSVVILTSNLGAATFEQARPGFGRDADVRRAARDHFLREVQAFFRPELYNRLDRVIPFAPLDENSVVAIARRELDLAAARDGVRLRRVALAFADDIAARLARAGLEPRYGARPLKRLIARQVLVPLAEALNGYGADVPLAAEVRGAEDGIRVQVRAPAAGRGAGAGPDPAAAGAAGRAAALRRQVQALERGAVVLDLRNEIHRLTRLSKRLGGRSWRRPEDQARLERLPEQERALVALEALARRIAVAEEQAVLAALGHGEADRAATERELEACTAERRALLLELFALSYARPDRITLSIWSESGKALFDLARAYVAVARTPGARVTLVRYEAGHAGRAAGPALETHAVPKPDEFLVAPRAGVIGIGLEVAGPLAFLRLEPEVGVSVFRAGEKSSKCLVHTSEAALADYRPPEGVERRGAIVGYPVRRTYDLDGREAEDERLEKKKFPWGGDAIEGALGRAVEEFLAQRAEEHVREGP